MVSIDMVVPDPWLSETLSRPAYKLIGDSFSNEDKEEFLKFLSKQPFNVFVYGKIPTYSVKSIHILESLGFRLVDTSVVFEKSLSRNQNFKTQADIKFAISEDELPTVNLARKTFQYSRFHLDPFIPKDRADHIKAEWVRNYFLGKRGKWLVIAKADGDYAGFLLLLKDEKSKLIIDLIAVSQEFQRKGIAREMISYAESHCKGVSGICVSTQIANIPSINLYEKMDFQLVNSNYVFHYHHS